MHARLMDLKAAWDTKGFKTWGAVHDDVNNLVADWVIRAIWDPNAPGATPINNYEPNAPGWRVLDDLCKLYGV